MPHASRIVRHVLLFAALSSALYTAKAQSPAPLTRSTPDGDVTIPVKTGVLGQKDPAAVAEIAAHQAAVGGGPWIGMQGVGKIVYAGNSATPYDATLSNLRSDEFRLDAGTSSGQTSLRIHRLIGKTQASDGTMAALPPETSLSGLFPFEIARMDMSSAAASHISLLDHGIAAIGNSSFHRITVESPSLGHNPRTGAQQTHVVDLYFDPATHLLVKSVAYDSLSNSRKVNFLFVVTYGDYRSVGNALVPFRFAETMEGDPYWTLQLSTVTLTPTLTSKDFEF